MSAILLILGSLTIAFCFLWASFSSGITVGFLLVALGAVTAGMVLIALGQILDNQESNTLKIDLINQKIEYMLQADQPIYTCSECKRTYKGERERCPHCYVSLNEKTR